MAGGEDTAGLPHPPSFKPGLKAQVSPRQPLLELQFFCQDSLDTCNIECAIGREEEPVEIEAYDGVRSRHLRDPSRAIVEPQPRKRRAKRGRGLDQHHLHA
jgi:hypothetical protein